VWQGWKTDGLWALYQTADWMFSSKQAPFLVTETDAQSIGTAWDNRPAYDGQWRQAAWALVSRGARMIEYWHWHTLHFGTETYWGGVLPHSGKPGRLYAELPRWALRSTKPESWSRAWNPTPTSPWCPRGVQAPALPALARDHHPQSRQGPRHVRRYRPEPCPGEVTRGLAGAEAERGLARPARFRHSQHRDIARRTPGARRAQLELEAGARRRPPSI
jgi:hypothetical protein